MTRNLPSIGIAAMVACLTVFPTSLQAAVVISISGTNGEGTLNTPTSLILDGSPKVTDSTPGDTLVGASVSELKLTLGALANAGTLGSSNLLSGNAVLTNTADNTNTIVITHGTEEAIFSIANPLSILIQQPSNGSFNSNVGINQSMALQLVSSTIADLADIGSFWDLTISFQGNFRAIEGNPGTFEFAPNYTASGSFTFAKHESFVVPEPASIVSFGIVGLAGMAGFYRKKRQLPVA